MVLKDVHPDPKLAPRGITGTQKDAAIRACDIVEATREVAGAYKLQAACWEALDPFYGITDMLAVINFIREVAPEVPIICDAKRGDVTNTSYFYAKSLFENWGCDAATLSPYLGQDACSPYYEYSTKGCLFLCKNSNPESGDFQNRLVAIPHEELVQKGWTDILGLCAVTTLERAGDQPMHLLPLYGWIALTVSRLWNIHENCLLVVGATYPVEMENIRELAPDISFLVPGIGSQGGDILAAVRAGLNSEGKGLLINSSRGIMYASSEADYAFAAQKAAAQLHTEILFAREQVMKERSLTYAYRH